MTLKDISEATGYSLTSIHRAIYNKEGVSKETRKKILAAVKSMGYEVNYLASSLKRKTLNIGFVGKKPRNGKDYHAGIAEGIRAAFSQDEGMNVALKEYYFDGSPAELEDEECILLSSLYDKDDLDGLVIMPTNTGHKMQLAIQRLVAKGYPVVLVDDAFPDLDTLCSVEPMNDLIGRMGAEFMGLIAPPGKILVVSGVPSSRGQMENYHAFINYVEEHCPNLSCVRIDNPTNDIILQERIIEATDNNVVGMYVTRETDTPTMCKAALQSGRDDLKLVGCDLSTENRKYLADGVLTAVLDMDSYLQGFLAMRILLDFLLKNITPAAQSLSVPVRLVLKNGLPFHEGVRSAGMPLATRLFK